MAKNYSRTASNQCSQQRKHGECVNSILKISTYSNQSIAVLDLPAVNDKKFSATPTPHIFGDFKSSRNELTTILTLKGAGHGPTFPTI